MDTPLVTVNILSFNRKDDLRITLQKVFEQDYKNIEVIVVDNASSDGTVEMVRIEFPSVQLIKMKRNVGIAGWNEGFKAAKGEYILVLDDDSYPEKFTIEIGLREFLDKSYLGIVSFRIYNVRFNKCETEDFQKHPYLFIGCGAMIKREVIYKIGYYNQDYFIYYHELDYSARCYNYGYTINYINNATVIHSQSLKSRGDNSKDPLTSEYAYYYEFVSYSIFLIQNFYFKHTVKYLSKFLLNRLIICLSYGYYKKFLLGSVFCLTKFKSLRKSGRILKTDVQIFYRNGNIAFIDRHYFPWFK